MATYPEDEEVLKRLSEKDKSALYTIYDKYSGALYGVIIRMCRDEGKAEDLLQETFVKIWQKIDTYDSSKGKFYTWAYRIAKNTTLNALRKPKQLIQTEDLSVYKDKVQTEITPDFAQLTGAIKKLEPHHQEAISLVYFRGYTHREAYEEMGVPLGTFKSYVRQALSLLRESYKKELIVLWFYMGILI
ncbi:sigma-70 family RNA polymerase sigma factor [Croceitalea sp. MTPC9]|uniref:RNA polymerase sigma factor n=1 Tax=unclassified Croceitalea TaxID=2632280 RepID=UPI002B3AA008|nr:sigma-70 family RNA polymerase sigma factor [Croceitalea sp. MTPC6]GMN17935.1 sigma-70 family RNA polymerase sigma factor [Croceitalea sp. MTPC9]